MKKTIYICDCCKNEIQTPVQITPEMVEGGEVYRLYNAALAPADVKLLESVHGKCRKWIEKQ